MKIKSISKLILYAYFIVTLSALFYSIFDHNKVFGIIKCDSIQRQIAFSSLCGILAFALLFCLNTLLTKIFRSKLKHGEPVSMKNIPPLSYGKHLKRLAFVEDALKRGTPREIPPAFDVYQTMASLSYWGFTCLFIYVSAKPTFGIGSLLLFLVPLALGALFMQFWMGQTSLFVRGVLVSVPISRIEPFLFGTAQVFFELTDKKGRVKPFYFFIRKHQIKYFKDLTAVDLIIQKKGSMSGYFAPLRYITAPKEKS